MLTKGKKERESDILENNEMQNGYAKVKLH